MDTQPSPDQGGQPAAADSTPAPSTPDPKAAKDSVKFEAPRDREEYIRRLEAELAKLRPADAEPEEQVQTHTALLATGRTIEVYGAIPTHCYDDQIDQTVPVVTAWPVAS